MNRSPAGLRDLARSLSVEKKPFLTALKSLRIGSRARQKDEAVFRFVNGQLSTELQGTSVQVPARGQWGGQVRIIARSLIPIATFPPDPDPLPLRFEDDRFYIAGWSVNASWQDAGERPLEIPDGAGAIDVLALRRQYSESELEASGVLKDVRNTEQFVKTQIAQAAAILQSVGIDEADLNRLLQDKVARRK